MKKTPWFMPPPKGMKIKTLEDLQLRNPVLFAVRAYLVEKLVEISKKKTGG
jgi:hypothetical protein